MNIRVQGTQYVLQPSRNGGTGQRNRIDTDPIATEIRFQELVIRSKNFSESNWKVEGTGLVDSSNYLILRIHFLKKINDTHEYQMIADSIANNLASKIDRILTRLMLDDHRELLDRAYRLGNFGTWEYDMINDDLWWSDMTKELHGFGPDYVPDVESTVMLFKEGFHRDTFAKTAVELEFQIEKVKLQVNKAFPTSLIINEILTNIFKHAFKGLKKGKITIHLKKMKQNKIKIEINDNGIGLPEDLEKKKSNSLGLMLVESMTRQMSATYTLKSSDKGTTFSLMI